MNDKQPVGYSEDAEENTVTSTNTINRMSASPRSITTQVAKLTYPGTAKPLKKIGTKKQCKPIQHTHDNLKQPESEAIDTARNEFSKKREERDKEVKEFKSYITGIATSREEGDKNENELNRGSTIHKNEELKINTITTFRRCKTEILSNKVELISERPITTRKGAKERSKSSHLPDTKSKDLLPSALCNTKRKSYNVEEARKFLQQQKRRRRCQQSASALKVYNEKNAFKKEEIKKRLEELRKNSRAIITKNVKRKKTPLLVKATTNRNVTTTEKQEKSIADIIVEPTKKTGIIYVENNNRSENKGTSATIETLSERSRSNGERKTANLEDGSFSENCGDQNASKVIKGNKPIPSQKRVGLLRKPETKDHSFSAIKEFSFYKENIALEMMTPKIRQHMPSEANAISKGKDIATITLDQPEKSLEVAYRKSINIENDLETLRPNEIKNIEGTKSNGELNYVPINCEASQSTLNVIHEKTEQNDLPYWLKPSTVQIYPYNFIMAVRRKLEALADVKQVHSQIKHHKTTSTKDLLSKRAENEQISFSKTVKELTLQSITRSFIPVSKNTFEESVVTYSADKDASPNFTKSKNYSTHSQSEVNSNISSISIQLIPSSNTVSQTSSKTSISIPLTYSKSKPDTQPEDDTTISSSIFNSPERNTGHKNTNNDKNEKHLQRSISPLSLDRVENLTITPNINFARTNAWKNVNTNRGDKVQAGTIDQKPSNNKIVHEEVNINQLLDDFNRSLSHVIAVNDRIKTTKNKTQYKCGTQDICGTQQCIEQSEYIDPKESDEYTEDFEGHSSQNSTCNKRSTVSSRNETITSEGELKGNTESSQAKVISISLCSRSRVASEETQTQLNRKFSQHELNKSDKRAQKIERVKKKVMQNISTSQKMRNSKENFKDFIDEQHNCIQTELLNGIPAPHSIKHKQKECCKSESVVDNIQTKGNIAKERNIEHSKHSPTDRSHEEKIKLNELQKNECGLCKRHLLPKYVTASHKVLEMFDSSNLEISIGSTNKDSLSDSACNYSNVGLYAKLIRNETTKSEHLSTLLKMREKVLFDRTKGQIAWLEVQKERCKSKGLLQQIVAIKKKQRGILLKMEKEREEIKRLLQSTTTTTSSDSYGKRTIKESENTLTKCEKIITQNSSPISNKAELERNEKICASQAPFPQTPSVKLISKYPRSNSKFVGGTTCSVPIIRANYALESTHSLEDLLRKRESDLRRRREHVERLMQWHRQLDQEEAEVLQMENAILNYNAKKNKLESIEPKNVNNYESDCKHLKSSSTQTKVQHRLKEIENSLRELSSIANTHITVESNECSENDKIHKSDGCVGISGGKLNKLWRRLTSQEIEKYKPDKHYQLYKSDLERLYEEAKVTVLNDFARHEGSLAADLLEKSISIISNNLSQTVLQQKKQENASIPSLNLCSSSGPSDKDEESWEATSGNSLLLGNYSPSTAAQNFNQFKCNSGSTILPSSLNQSSEFNIKLSKNKSELNLNPNMKNVSHHAGHGDGLMRSLSDTAIYNKDRSTQYSDVRIWKVHANYSNESKGYTLIKKQKYISDNIETNAVLPLSLSPIKQSLDKPTISNLNSVNKNLPLALDPPTEKLANITQTVVTPIQLEACGESEEFASKNNLFESCTAPSSFNTFSLQVCTDLKRISQEQENQSSSQIISSCVKTLSSSDDNNVATSHEHTSNKNLSAASLQETKMDSNSSCTNGDESNINQSINEVESFNSKTFVNESNSIHSDESYIEKKALNTYEDDFENDSNELTQIEDLSLPHLECIVNTSQPQDFVGQEVDSKDTKNDNEIENFNKCIQNSPEASCAERKNDTARRISAIIQTQLSPPPPPPPPPPLSSAEATRFQMASSLASNSVQLMPDIINELEVRRCQQILMESEKIQQFESSANIVPYIYVREIPNKPPPPYVPPAHGSPMTTIFPSEERIKEISYRRTHELYCELSKIDYISEMGEKLPSVKDEKITNIYERIILDICREYLEEHSEVLTKGNPTSFHTHLAFFNPPNRLRCIQESVYKEVRRCLAMDKTLNRCNPIYSVYGQRAKRDKVGKIITQEMYDEDSKWCNFHREETEVLDLIIYDMIGKSVIDIVEEVLIDEGGTVENLYQDNESESDIKIDSATRQPLSNCTSSKSNEAMQVEEES